MKRSHVLPSLQMSSRHRLMDWALKDNDQQDAAAWWDCGLHQGPVDPAASVPSLSVVKEKLDAQL